jgi:hypothetical protein
MITYFFIAPNWNWDRKNSIEHVNLTKFTLVKIIYGYLSNNLENCNQCPLFTGGKTGRNRLVHL